MSFLAGAGLFLLVGIPLLILESTGLYIGGRIVLPELGFSPLEWWTIFWASFWVGVFSLPIYAIGKLFDKL